MTMLENLSFSFGQAIGEVIEWAIADTRNPLVLLALALLLHVVTMLLWFRQNGRM